MTMGERITALRKGRGMTQEALAEKLGVTRQSVSKWELDQATPETGFAVALCDLFGVSLDYLIRGVEQPEEPTVTAVQAEESRPAEAPPAVKPLTGKGYALLFGGVFLLAELLCLNLYPIAILLDMQADFVKLFFLLYAVMIPLPAVYLTVNHWWYEDRRHALRHLWRITVGVAAVGNLVCVSGYVIYCRYVCAGLEYAFWQTQWITASYQWLVGELMTLAILLPALVCVRRRKWLCWVIYASSCPVFFWNVVILDAILGLVPSGLERYWELAYVGGYALVIGAILLSQCIVYRCMRRTSAIPSSLPSPHPVVMGVIWAVTVLSVTGGLHYALDAAGLPTAYLPMAYVLLPILALVVFRGRTDPPRALWRTALPLLGGFLPIMLLSHMGVCCFYCRFYACLGPMPDYHWMGYLAVSAVSALAGCAVALPLAVTLRKYKWACMAVAVGVLLLTAAATATLPHILW